MQRRIIPSQGGLDIPDISLPFKVQGNHAQMASCLPAQLALNTTALPELGADCWPALQTSAVVDALGPKKVEKLAFIQYTSSIPTYSSDQAGKDLTVKIFNDLDLGSQATSQLSTTCQIKFTHLYQKILCTENFPPVALKACM